MKRNHSRGTRICRISNPVSKVCFRKQKTDLPPFSPFDIEIRWIFVLKYLNKFLKQKIRRSTRHFRSSIRDVGSHFRHILFHLRRQCRRETANGKKVKKGEKEKKGDEIEPGEAIVHGVAPTSSEGVGRVSFADTRVCKTQRQRDEVGKVATRRPRSLPSFIRPLHHTLFTCLILSASRYVKVHA